jgi:plasmid stabilization system protein ParE
VATNLHEFPEKLPVVPELGLPYRERLVGRYRIIYKVEEERVVVLAVEHSARDLLAVIGERFQS